MPAKGEKSTERGETSVGCATASGACTTRHAAAPLKRSSILALETPPKVAHLEGLLAKNLAVNGHK